MDFLDADILDLADLAARSHDPTVDADLAELNEIEISEDMVSSRHRYDNFDLSPEEQFKREVIDDNKLALRLLNDGRQKDALNLLKRCEARVVQQIQTRGQMPFFMKLLSITLTNIAFYCRKKGIYQVALKYLARVLQIEKHALDQKVTLASTYLNISSILANLGKHKESYKYCAIANRMYLDIKEAAIEGGPSDPAEKTGLVSSYLNLATNCEQLGNFKAALSHANEGYHFALVELGPKHPLSVNVSSYLERLTKQMEHTAKKQSNNSRDNAFGSHRFRRDDDHSRGITLDYKGKRRSGSEQSGYDDDSFSGLPGISVKRAKTIEKPRRFENDIVLVDIKPSRPKSNVKSELNTLIENLKIPKGIKDKYAPQAPKSGMGILTAPKKPGLLRPGRNPNNPPPRQFNPLFVPNYGAESIYQMNYPQSTFSDPLDSRLPYYRAQTPIQHTQLYTMSSVQSQPMQTPVPTAQEMSMPSNHGFPMQTRLPPANNYSYGQPPQSNFGQTGSFGGQSTSQGSQGGQSGMAHQFDHSGVGYSSYQQPGQIFQGNHPHSSTFHETSQLGQGGQGQGQAQLGMMPKLPRLPDIEANEQILASRVHQPPATYSITVPPRGQPLPAYPAPWATHNPPAAQGDSQTSKTVNSPTYQNAITASALLTYNASGVSGTDDGNTLPATQQNPPQPPQPPSFSESKPKLNFNRLDAIHIDLRPKSTTAARKDEHQRQEVLQTKKTDGKDSNSRSDSEVRSLEATDESKKDGGRLFKKTVGFDEAEKYSLSQESENGMLDSAQQKWQVNVQYAERKNMDREDGQRVAKKNDSKTVTPPKSEAKSNTQSTNSSLTQSTLINYQYQTKNPYTMKGSDSVISKTEVESVDLSDGQPYKETKVDRLNEKYKPKMDKIKEEPSLADSKFLSMLDSHMGGSSNLKSPRRGEDSERKNYQITDVDMPDDGNFSGNKSDGNRTNFNASVASSEELKNQKPPMVTRSQVVSKK